VTVADTVRGGGVPGETTALMPLCRMGPPPRSLRRCALLHHGPGLCTHRIQGCGANNRAPHAAPLDVVIPDPSQGCRRARSRQGRAFGGADAPSLTAPARCRRNQSCGRDEETGGPGRTNKLRDKKIGSTRAATPLTRNTPYKVSRTSATLGCGWAARRPRSAQPRSRRW
jgi:hypothetical protein